MSSNKAGGAMEAPVTSNPLDFVPDHIPFDVPYLPPDVELDAGWNACIASLGRPSTQHAIKELMARGFHKPGT